MIFHKEIIMARLLLRLGLFVGLLGIHSLTGCSSDKNNPLAAFQPEIINNTDAFEFQITDASNVTTTVSYTWANTGTQATIDHSTVTVEGSASINIQDADGTEVYSTPLAASLNEATTAGTAGDWTITVSFTNFSGTANFRAEKL